jgi:hypothetical protein
MKTQEIKTNSLGFEIKLVITVGDFEKLGSHITYEENLNLHKINIKSGLNSLTLSMVAAHEAYHMFYTIRHLITVDEETEAEVFGELVKKIVAFSLSPI